MERPRTYPNGIAFDARGVLYWTESRAHRVCRLDDGNPVTFSQLSDNHVPDGMAFADDGRLFVCTTTSDGVTVLAPSGEIIEEITLGEECHELHLQGLDLVCNSDQGAGSRRTPAHGHPVARRDRRHRTSPAWREPWMSMR